MSKKHASQFLNELEAAQRVSASVPVILMFIAIIGIVVLGIAWASVAQIDKITRGAGQVVPSQDVQYVQSLEGGIVEAVLVSQGQRVEKGDIVMRIDNTQYASEGRGIEARRTALSAQKLRLEAEAQGKSFNLPDAITQSEPAIAKNEQALYQSRIAEQKNAAQVLNDRITRAKAQLGEVGAQINRLSTSRNSLQKELNMTRDLVAKRAVPKIEEMRLERELSDIKGQINAYAQSRKALQAEVQAAQSEKKGQDNAFRSKALTELSKIEADLASLKESAVSAGDRLDRTELRAPVTGVVNNIMINTVGGIVEPAMKVMEIVPVDDALKISAKIQPSDIGFIQPGQAVKVKISAYDPQIYGAIDGVLTRVGANAMSDPASGEIYFEVDVKTDTNHLGSDDTPLPISPGMQADIDILTGKRTVMNYLLKPLFRAKEHAFTEQ